MSNNALLKDFKVNFNDMNVGRNFQRLIDKLPDEVYKLIYMFAIDRNMVCSESNYGRCLAFTYTFDRMEMYHFRNVLVNDFLSSLPTSRGYFMLTLAINTVPLDTFYDALDEYAFVDSLAESLITQYEIMSEILFVTRPRLLKLQQLETRKMFMKEVLPVTKPLSLKSMIPEHERRLKPYRVKSGFKTYTNVFGDIVVINRKPKRKKSMLAPQSVDIMTYILNKFIKSPEVAVYFNEKYICKLIDDLVHFVRYATETVVGMTRIDIIIRACTNFMKLRFNESTFHTLRDRALPFLLGILDKMNVQSFEDHLDSARACLNGAKNIFASPIFSKLHQCCLYMMSLSIFEKMGINLDFLNYSALEKAAMRKKYSSVTDFFYVLCETLLFIAERGYQVYISGDYSTIFHSGGQYKKIYDMCRDLTRKQPLLNDPESHGFTESGFRADLDNVIEKLTSINKYSHCLNGQEKLVVKETLNRMLMMRDDLNTRSAARKNRKAPFGILIYGDSGVGKTTVALMMCIYFAKHEGLSTASEFRYTLNPASEFWDGFVSSCHTLMLDDVANEHPDLKDSKSLDSVIQVMNNQSFCPNQASLEAKGKTPFRGKLVVATTNVKNLNAYAYFSCPSAVQRRFPFIITPKPKKEFLDDKGMLCTENVYANDPYPELWFFDVDMVVPVPASQGRVYANIVKVHENLSTKGLLKWYHNAIEKFNRDQKKVEECILKMEAEEICICCHLPDSLCENRNREEEDLEEKLCECCFLPGSTCENLRPQSGDMDMACLGPRSGIVFMREWITAIILISAFLYYIDFLCIQTLHKSYLKMCVIKQDFVKKREEVLNKVMTISTPEFWSTMGEKVKSIFGNYKTISALASVVAAVLGVYYVTKNTLKPQGDLSESIGTRPVPEKDGRENVWYNNAMELTSANFTRESSSSKSMSFDDFKKKISQNVIFIATPVKDSTLSRVGKLLCLGGHVYVTNNHNLPDCSDHTSCTLIQSSRLGLTSNIDIVLSESDIYRVPERDLAFITIRELPPKKKITQYFLREADTAVFNGVYVSRHVSGEIKTYNIKNIQMVKKQKYKFPKNSIDADLICWKGISDEETLDGDCGAPLLVESEYGYAILGIHFLIDIRTKCDVFANAVDGAFIDQVYAKLSHFNIQSGDMDMISSESVKRPVGDLHKKSVFRYINDGNAEIYGSFNDFRGKSKSRVVDTPMSKVLPKTYKKKYTQPEMISYEPWRIAALDLVKPVKLNTSILNMCMQGYVNDVNRVLNKDNLNMLMVLDDFTAINGAQVAYIDKINRNTSAGNPWKKSKKYFLKSIPPDHGMMDPVCISFKEINDRIDLIIKTYLSGTRCNPNFCAHLKDEPVTFKKAREKKTRVFTGAPFDWCVVVRKYLLSFCRLLQNERFAFEAAPGTVAQSLEWQEIYDYLSIHGIDRIVAGDYKAYDKKMSPKEILAAFDIIIHYCELSGNYTTDDIVVIRGIAEDTAFAVVDFNGDLIQLYGSNPSGNPLTVILNSIVNSLRMRYVYYLLNPDGEVMSFGTKVSLMTYGDDNIMSVHENCNWFNHTSIAQAFAEIGIVYTMADKEEESKPFIHIDDSSFLKRKWRYDENLKCRMGPLDHDSIEKMLMVWVKSKAVTEEYQGVSVICTALQEYFFYGEEIFREKRHMLVNLIEKLGWQHYVNKETFPTYDELCLRFKKSSSKCFTFEECFGVQSGYVSLDEIKWRKSDVYLFWRSLNRFRILSFLYQYYKNIKLTSVALVSAWMLRCNNAFTHITVVWATELRPMIVSLPTGGKDAGLFVHDTIRFFSFKKVFSVSQQKTETVFDVFSQKTCLVDNIVPYRGDDIDAIDCSHLKPQSGEQPERAAVNTATTTEVNMTFDDEAPVKTLMRPVTSGLYKPTGSRNADLSEFLSRPVNIYTNNMAIGANIIDGFNPWYLYFNTTSIKKKIDNYAFVRCNLHIKVVVNASPFYYGAILYSYAPLAAEFESARINAGSVLETAYSQRPHFIVYPQTGEAGEMVLPFLYHREWLPLTSATSLNNMGRITVDSFTPLRSANGTVGTSIDVKVYAWAEDVELAGLTVNLAVQSGEEYGKGVISKPASAVARATGLLSDTPVIGPFMTATSVAAGAVSNIASLFGYTKVPVLDDVKPVKNLPFHALAVSDVSECSERLCVDSKNELTINNKCIGDASVDPLSISSFVQRSAYLTQFTWTAAATNNTLLWNSYVTPFLSALTAGTGQTIVNGTPMWLVANMFNYWRGDIIFDLKIVCTQYHKGRLRISWDPVGDVANTTDSSTEVFTTIIDIADTTTVSLRVPYCQRTAYHKSPSDLTATIYGTSPLAVDTQDFVNGILTVRVCNPQTSPIASADIIVLVTVRGGENLEFAAPCEPPANLHYFTVQSGLISQNGLDDITEVTFGGHSTVDPHVNLVYFGEKVSNLRSLLMRANESVVTFLIDSTAQDTWRVATMNRRPIFRGYDPNGIHSAVKQLAAGNAPYNFVNNTPYHMLSSCFLGERGSFTWRIDYDTSDCISFMVTRPKTTLVAANYLLASTNMAAFNTNSMARHFANNEFTCAGAALLNQKTNTGMAVNAPQYSIFSFLPTAPEYRVLGKTGIDTDDALRYTNIKHTSRAEHVALDIMRLMFEVGLDYSPVFFMNVPTMYIYASTPAAP